VTDGDAMMQCDWLQRRLHSPEYRKRQSAKKAIRDICLGGLIHIKSGSGIGTLRRQMPYMDAGERLRFWRLRAEELRATASQFKDQIGKKGLWDAAEYYDRLADPTKSLTRTHRQRSGCNDVSFAQATPQVARPNTADRGVPATRDTLSMRSANSVRKRTVSGPRFAESLQKETAGNDSLGGVHEPLDCPQELSPEVGRREISG
jgi:hypothetical protein